ncbi:MAG: hypothetical protein IH940_02560 [Acidobacteria bacterium]|nr:hypothetical protein [Acidobacteriota bacterium]
MTSENSSPAEIARGVARKAGVNRAALRDASLRIQQVFSDYIVGVNDPLCDVRFVLDGATGSWLLNVYGMYFLVEDSNLAELCSILPMQISIGPNEIEGRATIETDEHVVIVVGHGRSSQTRIELDRSELNVVAPISITPQSQVDGWVPTSFTLRAEHLSRIEIHTYLPDADGFGAKEYVVSTKSEVVAVGTIARGSMSSIVIDHECDRAGTEFNVRLAYPELSTQSELRHLGAILTGVSRILPKKAFDA